MRAHLMGGPFDGTTFDPVAALGQPPGSCGLPIRVDRGEGDVVGCYVLVEPISYEPGAEEGRYTYSQAATDSLVNEGRRAVVWRGHQRRLAVVWVITIAALCQVAARFLLGQRVLDGVVLWSFAVVFGAAGNTVVWSIRSRRRYGWPAWWMDWAVLAVCVAAWVATTVAGAAVVIGPY